MARQGDVQFRGTRGGLLVRFDEGEDFERLKERLAERLDAAQKFFHGSAVTIDIGNRVLTTKQLLELENLFSSRYGVRILQVVNGGLEQADAEAGPDSGDPPAAEGEGERDPAPLAKPSAYLGLLPAADVAADTLLVKRTIRSGQRIAYNGNVVVLGDVNPGAEVVASGDVVVMGHLRGVVHAGAAGNEKAIVVAFRLSPTQLRIGNRISRAPDWEPLQPEVPEVARIRDGEVVIDPYPSLSHLEEAVR